MYYYDEETRKKYIRRAIVFIVLVLVLPFVILAVLHIVNQPIINSPEYTVVSVRDGDTIEIDYNGIITPIRLIGVNTPETKDSKTNIECFGPEASEYLTNLLSNKKVKIEADPSQDNLDKFNRLLRYVYLNNEDVGLKLISGGYGDEYTYNSENPYKKQSEYLAVQSEAKKNSKGKWAVGICDSSSTNKDSESNKTEEKKQENKNNGSTSQQCLIKGNINKKGEKIYHVPGQQYYDETIIDTSKGERMFCTEEEAVAAGWRKSKV